MITRRQFIQACIAGVVPVPVAIASIIDSPHKTADANELVNEYGTVIAYETSGTTDMYFDEIDFTIMAIRSNDEVLLWNWHPEWSQPEPDLRVVVDKVPEAVHQIWHECACAENEIPLPEVDMNSVRSLPNLKVLFESGAMS